MDEYRSIQQTYDPSKNLSSPLITKYELNQVISLRMLHISKGSPTYIPVDRPILSNIELRAFVERELVEGKLPYMIKRAMPNGKTEYWRLKDMDFTAVKSLLVNP